MRGGSGGVVRRTIWGLALLQALTLAPPPAWASELPLEDDVADRPQADGDFSLDGDPGLSNNMWLWVRGRRAYTVTQQRNPATDPQWWNTAFAASNTMTIVARDLDTGEESARATFDRAWQGENSGHLGQDSNKARHVAVDEEGGRLFVPFRHNTTGPTSNTTQAQQSGARCVSFFAASADAGGGPCLAGLFVLDAGTLEVQSRINLGSIQVDNGLLLAPRMVAMSYAPGTEAGEPGKVLLLVRSDDTDAFGDFNGVLYYVIQIDPTAGHVDWVVRAEGCRGNRTTGMHNRMAGTPNGTYNIDSARFWRRLNEGVVFRAGEPGQQVIWIGCYLSNRTSAVVKIPLDASGAPAALPYQGPDTGQLAAAPENDPASGGQDALLRPSPAGPQEVIVGPKEVREYLADPASERILARVYDNGAEVWWIFDGRKGAYLGTIGIGRYPELGTVSGLDPSTGRLYVLTPAAGGEFGESALFVADTRRTPIPQALLYPGYAELLQPRLNVSPILVDYGAGDAQQPPRLFVRKGDVCCGDTVKKPYSDVITSEFWSPYAYRILSDPTPVTADPELELAAGRTLDLEEIEGVTQSTFDGAARGFAARALFIGGLTAVGRASPVDPTAYDESWVERGNTSFGGLHTNASECRRNNRQVVIGFVGPRDAAVVDAGGSRGGAEPVVVDSGTRSDAELPLSRCTVDAAPRHTSPQPIAEASTEWEALWAGALFGRSPLDEPTVPWTLGDGQTECVSSDQEPSRTFGDPVTGMFAAHVECGAEEASGYGYARGASAGELSVSEAISRFRIYRDPGRGIVSRVESIARGIDVAGQIRIDTIRGVAESWANGRRQPLDQAEREEGYDPNCDLERTAGTCFQRHIFGVRTPAYSCGPCGDEDRLVDALGKAMGSNGRVRLRDPDQTLRRGTENGFIAAIQKPAHERFSDVVLNDDLLQTVVPVLEIVRYAQPGYRQLGVYPQHSSPAVRGMQVYQFAGVEVSSSYGIQCLLVYDEEANTCGAPVEPPGAITVSLQDGEGEPLAGGAFEVRQDVDADGVLGLVDTLLPDGACVTGDDGIGTCLFEGLEPGTYLVNQVAAPPGYAKSDEPFVVELASGEQRTVAFTNVSNVSTIELTAQDENGGPLQGATFAAYPDPDADGKVAPDAQPAATCTTGADGTCTMQVPAGSYVLVQTAVPGGLEGIEPVPFTFASGGQVAAVTITNYPPLVEGPPPAASPEVVYTPPVDIVPPVESIDDDYVSSGPLPEVAPEGDGLVGQVGGTVVQVIRAPGDALRLLSRDPKQAVAWIAALALFCLAVMAIRRRQHAMALLRG